MIELSNLKNPRLRFWDRILSICLFVCILGAGFTFGLLFVEGNFSIVDAESVPESEYVYRVLRESKSEKIERWLEGCEPILIAHASGGMGDNNMMVVKKCLR